AGTGPEVFTPARAMEAGDTRTAKRNVISLHSRKVNHGELTGKSLGSVVLLRARNPEFVWRRIASEVVHEVIPAPTQHVRRIIRVTMVLVRQDQKIEIAVGLDQRIHHEISLASRHVVVDRTVH